MNRRGFFRSIAIASAALYLRLAPSVAKAVPAAMPEAPKPIENKYDDCVRGTSYGFYNYKGVSMTAEQILAQLPRSFR